MITPLPPSGGEPGILWSAGSPAALPRHAGRHQYNAPGVHLAGGRGDGAGLPGAAGRPATRLPPADTPQTPLRHLRRELARWPQLHEYLLTHQTFFYLAVILLKGRCLYLYMHR